MKWVVLQVFCALFSGIMEALAIPNKFLPLGEPLFALFALSPLYIALFRAKTYKESFFIMTLQPLVVHLLSSFWLANFRDFAIFTLGASAIGTAAEGGIIGIIFHALPSTATSEETNKERAGCKPFAPFTRVIWFAERWVTWEWFKSTGFLAYPWGTLPLAAYRWRILAQTASLTGVWGVTFLYSLANALLGEGILQLSSIKCSPYTRNTATDYRQLSFFVAGIFAASFLYGLYEYWIPRKQTKTVNIVAVQQNQDPWDGGEKKSLELSMRLTEKGVQNMRSNGIEPDIVLWSEGILSHSFPNSRFYYSQRPEQEPLSAFIRRMDVPFLIGGQTVVNMEAEHYSNSAIFYDRRGQYAGFYSKIHLVPFAEDIPFDETPLMKLFMEKAVGFTSGWTPGSQLTAFRIPVRGSKFFSAPLENGLARQAIIPLDVAGVSNPDNTLPYTENLDENPSNYLTFAVPICFEDAFPDVCTPLYNLGTEIFMNITNDSWSKTESAEYQHFAIASYLAIEYRIPLVRCTNSGYTVVLDPAGRITDSLPLFTENVMCSSIPVYERKPTVFSRFGDWLPYTIFVYMFITVLHQIAKISKLRHIKKFTIQISFKD